jgi:branched-chain amino acid transport system ATP-binding protein
MTEPVLEVRDLVMTFGGVKAVSNVSFRVDKGEMVGLIGPNGAGKTTTLKAIMGVTPITGGRLLLDGQDISALKTSRRNGLGLAMSHQIVRPFRQMTVVDNVPLAAGGAITRRPLTSIFHISRARERKLALAALERVNIAHFGPRGAAKQPLGVLKRLEVARALATNPRILLLDEPLAGLGHGETRPIADLIKSLNADGVTILLVEHNLVEARRICSRFVVLDNGRKIADGPADEVMRDPSVIDAYIGKDVVDA